MVFPCGGPASSPAHLGPAPAPMDVREVFVAALEELDRP